MTFKNCSKKVNFLKILYIVPALFIVGYIKYYLDKNFLIKIVPDEYGYWAAGAFFAGLDWTEVTSNNVYYGYGYGLILSLLLRMNFDSVITYKLAIVLNGCLLIMVYCIALHLVKNWNKERNVSEIVCILIACIATIYVGNLYYSQYTMCEVFLIFLYWLLIYLATRILTKISFIKCVLFMMIAIFSMCVHMRNIGIVVVSMFFLMFVILKEKKGIKWMLGILVIFASLYFLMTILGNNFKAVYYYVDNRPYLEGNEISGQIDKIRYLLTKEGCIAFFQGMLGKIYYCLTSTYLMIAYPCVYLVKDIYISIKNKSDISNKVWLLVFLYLSTVCMMAIDTIYMINYKARFDLLTYGRYFEHTLSPLIAIAFCITFENEKDKNFKISSLIVMIYCMIGLLINSLIPYGTSTGITFISSVGISDVLIKHKFAKDTILLVGIRTVVIFAIIKIIRSTVGKKKSKILSLVLIGMLWVKSSSYVFENACLNWSKNNCESEIKLAEHIKNIDADDKLYYYVMEHATKADMLQFVLKGNTIHVFYDLDDCKEKYRYILTDIDEEIIFQMSENKFEEIAKSNNLILWENKLIINEVEE